MTRIKEKIAEIFSRRKKSSVLVLGLGRSLNWPTFSKATEAKAHLRRSLAPRYEYTAVVSGASQSEILESLDVAYFAERNLSKALVVCEASDHLVASWPFGYPRVPVLLTQNLELLVNLLLANPSIIGDFTPGFHACLVFKPSRDELLSLLSQAIEDKKSHVVFVGSGELFDFNMLMKLFPGRIKCHDVEGEAFLLLVKHLELAKPG